MHDLLLLLVELLLLLAGDVVEMLLLEAMFGLVLLPRKPALLQLVDGLRESLLAV